MRTSDKLEPSIMADLPADVLPATRASLEHIAMCAAQLVIARTINASRFPPLPPPHMRAATAQARHFARVQSNLQAWMNEGGFAADDADTAPYTPIAADCADTCLE
jgi:hypothetical protein